MEHLTDPPLPSLPPSSPIQLRVAREWMQWFDATTAPQLGSFSAHELVTVGWALAKQRYQPSRRWVEALVAASGPMLQSMTDMQLARTSWYVGRVCKGHPSMGGPGPVWLSHLLQAARGRTFSPETEVAMARALQSLLAPPPPRRRAQRGKKQAQQQQQQPSPAESDGQARMKEEWEEVCVAAGLGGDDAGVLEPHARWALLASLPLRHLEQRLAEPCPRAAAR